jgi:hypothetical protein
MVKMKNPNTDTLQKTVYNPKHIIPHYYNKNASQILKTRLKTDQQKTV